MKLTNLKITDLIIPDAKLTFLVGAGCSVDPPSCLPAGRAMMDAIIDYTCAESEIDKIKELKGLRFEQLIEIIRDRLDPNLKIIDFYGECDKPNNQHFFLAEMMKKGQFVLTTNFDFLIEYALQQSGIPDEDIIPVITKEDYLTFQDPYEQLKLGKKTSIKFMDRLRIL
jgi:NAD-dependent SIR2 family protein deacetylase